MSSVCEDLQGPLQRAVDGLKSIKIIASLKDWLTVLETVFIRVDCY